MSFSIAGVYSDTAPCVTDCTTHVTVKFLIYTVFMYRNSKGLIPRELNF